MQITRLLLDFGLVVLIWMVQIIVYPGFTFYSKKDLGSWHKTYTARLPVIVVPLMLGQLIVAGWMLLMNPSFYTIGSLLIIVLLWLLTFLIFVPLHQHITKDPGNNKAIVQLVSKNWLRTVLWTILFLWSLSEMLL